MVKFVCDSSCDMLTMPGVCFEAVPLTISTEERRFVDDASLDLDDMLDYLAAYKGRSYSACPGFGDWLKAYSGADIVYAAVLTGTLSGAYNAAVAAKKLYEHAHPRARVHVFNTLTTGPELRLFMEKLVELHESGLSFDEVAAQAEAYLRTTRLFFSFQSLHNFAQNGRVSKAAAAACGVLNIRVVGTAGEDGTVKPLAKVRGDRKALAELYRYLEAMAFQKGKLRIGHTRNPALAEQFRAGAAERYPEADIRVYAARGLCSYYGESGALFFAAESR